MLLDPMAHVLTRIRPLITIPDLERRRPISRIVNSSLPLSLLELALVRLSQFTVLKLNMSPLHLLVGSDSLRMPQH